MLRKFFLDNLALIAVSFGVGLLLSSQYIWGIAPILVGIIIYFVLKKRKPQREQQKINIVEPKLPFDFGAEEALEGQEVPQIAGQWYYYKDDLTIGPESEEKLIELIEQNILSSDTFVFNETLGNDWIEIKKSHLNKYLHNTSDIMTDS